MKKRFILLSMLLPAMTGCFSNSGRSANTSAPVVGGTPGATGLPIVIASASPTPLPIPSDVIPSPSPSASPDTTASFAQYRAMVAALPAVPGDSSARVRRNIPYTSSDTSLVMDIYFPVYQDAYYPLILFIHGGYLSQGSKSGTAACDNTAYSTTNPNCQCPAEVIVKAGFVVACMSMHPSSQSKLPTQISQAKRALAFLRINSLALGFNKDRVAAWGVDFGGYIATMLGASSVASTASSFYPGVLDGPENGAFAAATVVQPVQAVIAYSSLFDPTLVPKYFTNDGKTTAGAFDQRLDPAFQIGQRASMVPTLVAHGDTDRWNVTTTTGATQTIDSYAQALTFYSYLYYSQKVPTSRIQMLKVTGGGGAFYTGQTQNAAFFSMTTNQGVGSWVSQFLYNIFR